MLDIKFIREHSELVKKAALDKKAHVDIERLLEVDKRRRELMTEQETLRAEQKKRSQSPSTEDIDQLKALKERIHILTEELTVVAADFEALMMQVPNIPSDDTPIGLDESGNVPVRTWGDIPSFDFKPKEHWELGQALGVIDMERAVKVSGSRFVYLKGGLALVQYALIQFAFSILTDEKKLASIAHTAGLQVPSTPFIPIVPPVIVKPESMSRMGRLEPREERYHLQADDQYLVGSAEHALGPMHADETFFEGQLPLRYAGMSTAFRREAGSYGKDMKGILRVHQFDKLELESFSTAEDGRAEQDFFVAIQEHILQALQIPYRVMAICTGDMGGPDARQIDLESWMPGQDRYRETHTADYMTDYQARRLMIKVKRSGGESQLVHMNDATCIAIGRTLIAIMENYQTAEGHVRIPDVLQPYMGGMRELS